MLQGAIVGFMAILGFLAAYCARDVADYIKSAAQSKRVPPVCMIAHIACDCGNATFYKFGRFPHPGDSDDGLRMIYTCTTCGDQLRVYQASKMEPSKTEETKT